MKITKKSNLSGKTHTRSIDITQEQLDRVNNRHHTGEYIQDIVPDLNSTDREFLMTGITEEEWNTTMSDDEEEDPEIDLPFPSEPVVFTGVHSDKEPQEKRERGIAIVGHVGHGKTTLSAALETLAKDKDVDIIVVDHIDKIPGLHREKLTEDQVHILEMMPTLAMPFIPDGKNVNRNKKLKHRNYTKYKK